MLGVLWNADTYVEAGIIVKRLHGLPLALAQAGAYIYEMGITPKKYLESCEARTHDIMTQNNDITYANGSIMATFQISYDATLWLSSCLVCGAFSTIPMSSGSYSIWPGNVKPGLPRVRVTSGALKLSVNGLDLIMIPKATG